MMMYRLAPLALAMSCSLSLLSGCSDSSNDKNNVSISGSIVAAPVAAAEVSVLDPDGNLLAGPVSTDAQGRYTLSLADNSLSQDLIIQSVGGHFTDEATGNDGLAGEMLVYVSANSLLEDASISATPASTIIARLVMEHSKTLSQAETLFSEAFAYIPDVSVIPADVTKVADGVDEKEKLAGFRAAAFSQLAMDLGLSQNNQFELFAAIARDLSDEKLDGVDASGPVDVGNTGIQLAENIQNRVSMALANFHNSAYNQSELASNQIGNLPFSKVAFTDSYKIEYKQTEAMGAMEGKSSFQLHITDRNTAADVAGLMPMVMPMMHMTSMTHSSPVADMSVRDEGDGLYTVTVYYLMASQMMDGTSMGYWDLQLSIGDETAHFYPRVSMAMGDTVKTRLKGQSDLIKNMMAMDVSRDYYIFKDSLQGTGPYTLTLFVAAKESMMSYPPLKLATSLQSGMGGSPLSVDSVELNVSVNNAAPLAAIDNGDGTWSVSLDLNKAEANQLDVELWVNGERKTSDGTAAGLNASFTITPVTM